MKSLLHFLSALLGSKSVKIFWTWPITALILAACAIDKPIATMPDGAPVQHAVKNPVERYESLSLEKLRSLGFNPKIIDMGGNEYGIYISRNDKIKKTISAGRIRIRFSLWDTKGNFVLALPSIADDASPFILTEGYRLQIALIPTAAYDDLVPGTSYLAILNPPKIAK